MKRIINKSNILIGIYAFLISFVVLMLASENIFYILLMIGQMRMLFLQWENQ